MNYMEDQMKRIKITVACVVPKKAQNHLALLTMLVDEKLANSVCKLIIT